MKTQGWVWALGLCLPLVAFAHGTCRPPNDRPLVIGHSHKLDWFTIYRLKTSARLLGYRIRLQDLRREAEVAQALRLVDGFIVPGGADINPSYYDHQDLPAEVAASIAQFRGLYKPTLEGERRDSFEHELYRTYYAQAEFADMPVLGICRGMQMMAVAKGIPLVLDLKAELGIKNRYNRFDRFRVQAGASLMDAIFPAGSGKGFKYHHQNPRQDYLARYPERHPDVKVTATSWEGRVVEAIELTDRPALGVQFHPEKSFPSVKHHIFKWLLNASCERSQQGASL